MRRDRLWLTGLTRIAGFDGIPSYSPDNLIDAIRRWVDQVHVAAGELLETLKSGNPRKIQEGPVKSYEAILDAHLAGALRVRVLSTFLIETTRAAHRGHKAVICPCPERPLQMTVYRPKPTDMSTAMSAGRSALERRRNPKASV